MSQEKAKQPEYGMELKLAGVRRVLAGGWPTQARSGLSGESASAPSPSILPSRMPGLPILTFPQK
jgi:hypothetical protein